MTGRPRLLVLVNESGHFLSHRTSLARAAREAGWDVHLVTNVRHRLDRLQAHGVTVHDVSFPRNVAQPWLEWQTVRQLTAVYREVAADVVQHFSAKAILLGSLAAARAGSTRVVNTFTGLGSLLAGRGARQWCRRQLAVRALRHALHDRPWVATFQNPEDLSEMTAAGVVPHERCRLIRSSGVNCDEFHPTGKWPKRPRVMLAARMIAPKGIYEFVEAARILRQRKVTADCVLVGPVDPGHSAAIREAELRQWHGSGIVQWWGACGNMPYTLNRSTIVTLPSYYGEGVPKVLLEAASCARPVVTTYSRGCKDVVLDGHNGLLIPAHDAAALAEAVISLLDQPWRARQMGHAGRELVLQHFTVAQVNQQTLTLYAELLGQTARQTADQAPDRAADQSTDQDADQNARRAA